MATVKEPTPDQAEQIAINHVVNGLNMVDCYKLYKPNTKANPKSIRSSASILFKYGVVQQSLANIHASAIESARSDMKITIEGQNAKLQAVIDKGMSVNQLASVVSAVTHQSQMAQLYDKGKGDAPTIYERDYGFNDKVIPIKKKGGD